MKTARTRGRHPGEAHRVRSSARSVAVPVRAALNVAVVIELEPALDRRTTALLVAVGTVQTSLDDGAKRTSMLSPTLSE